MFIQQLINGLSVGSVYALMAVGYALIFSLLNFTNFAHGVSVTIAAFVAYFFMAFAMESLVWAIVAGIVGAVIVALSFSAWHTAPLSRGMPAGSIL